MKRYRLTALGALELKRPVTLEGSRFDVTLDAARRIDAKARRSARRARNGKAA